jgi:hypothetical protein
LNSVVEADDGPKVKKKERPAARGRNATKRPPGMDSGGNGDDDALDDEAKDLLQNLREQVTEIDWQILISVEYKLN